MSTTRYQTRIQAFAHSKNERPEDVAPGQDFIDWINRQWTEFCANHKPARGQNHAAFDAWLTEKYGGKPC